MLKRKTSDWLINPLFLFFSLWISQFLFHQIFSDSYDPFLNLTWVIVLIGLCAFFFGSISGQVINNIFFKQELESECVLKTFLFVKVIVFIFLPIYIVSVALPLLFGIMSNSDLSFSEIRDVLIDSTIERDIAAIYLSYLHYFIVLSCLLSLTWASNFKKITISYILITGFLAGFLTFGRNILFLYFISLGVIFYFQNLINKKVASLIVLIFVILFFMMAYVLGKGGSENGLIDSIIWNFKVYVINGVAAFNYYINTGEPSISGSLLIPNLIKSIVLNFGIDVPLTAGLLPFVETPFPTNVYTAFYPWFHDGGFIGLFVGFYLIGLMSMYLFEHRYRSRMSLFFYSLSLYPLAMTIFDEQYLRAYPLWLMVAILCIMVFIFEKFKLIFSS